MSTPCDGRLVFIPCKDWLRCWRLLVPSSALTMGSTWDRCRPGPGSVNPLGLHHLQPLAVDGTPL